MNFRGRVCLVCENNFFFGFWYALVCYAALFSVVTQRSFPCQRGGALRDDTKNGCVADQVCVDAVNVEISMNPKDQCRLCTFVLSIRLTGRTARVEVLKFQIKTSRKLDLKCLNVQAFKSSILDPRRVFVQGQSSAKQNGFTVLARAQTTRVALVKAYKTSKNKANPVADEVRVENRNHGVAGSCLIRKGNTCNRTVTIQKLLPSNHNQQS